ncbi:MAG: hypothetical protein RLZZ630_1534 [Bacteroidota bacterium]
MPFLSPAPPLVGADLPAVLVAEFTGFAGDFFAVDVFGDAACSLVFPEAGLLLLEAIAEPGLTGGIDFEGDGFALEGGKTTTGSFFFNKAFVSFCFESRLFRVGDAALDVVTALDFGTVSALPVCFWGFAVPATAFFTGFTGVFADAFLDVPAFADGFSGFLAAFMALFFFGAEIFEAVFTVDLAFGFCLTVAFFFCFAVAIEIRRVLIRKMLFRNIGIPTP